MWSYLKKFKTLQLIFFYSAAFYTNREELNVHSTFNYYYYVSGSMRHWKKNVFLHVPNCSPHDYAYSEIRVFQPIVNLMASSKANVGDWLPCMEIGSIIWNGKAIQRNTLNKFEILFIILFRFFGRFEVQITNSFRTAIWFTNSAANKNQLEVVSKK